MILSVFIVFDSLFIPLRGSQCFLATPPPILTNLHGPTPGVGWSEGCPPFLQPTCLAEFKQIKSIRCLPLEEGQAVLQLGIEGAPQVSISGHLGALKQASTEGQDFLLRSVSLASGILLRKLHLFLRQCSRLTIKL